MLLLVRAAGIDHAGDPGLEEIYIGKGSTIWSIYAATAVEAEHLSELEAGLSPASARGDAGADQFSIRRSGDVESLRCARCVQNHQDPGGRRGALRSLGWTDKNGRMPI